MSNPEKTPSLILSNIAVNCKELLVIREKLGSELSEIDLCISDVNHYLEFFGEKLNMFHRNELAKKLFELLKERRRIKDECHKLQRFLHITNEYLKKYETPPKKVKHKPRTNIIEEMKKKKLL
jgi:predicted DNA-binding protein YlxM (UPF0122 family)